MERNIKSSMWYIEYTQLFIWHVRDFGNQLTSKPVGTKFCPIKRPCASPSLFSFFLSVPLTIHTLPESAVTLLGHLITILEKKSYKTTLLHVPKKTPVALGFQESCA